MGLDLVTSSHQGPVTDLSDWSDLLWNPPVFWCSLISSVFLLPNELEAEGRKRTYDGRLLGLVQDVGPRPVTVVPVTVVRQDRAHVSLHL